MAALIISFVIGVIGVFLIIYAFRQLAKIKVFYKERNWRWRLIRVIRFVVSLAVGSIFVLFYIFIHTVKGIDMEMMLFLFITSFPLGFCWVAIANKDDYC